MFFRCSPPLPGHLGSRIGQVFTPQEGQIPAETLYVSCQPQFLVFRCTQPEKSSENATLCSLRTYGFIHRCLLGATLCHVLSHSSSVVSSSASTPAPIPSLLYTASGLCPHSLITTSVALWCSTWPEASPLSSTYRTPIHPSEPWSSLLSVVNAPLTPNRSHPIVFTISKVTVIFGTAT